MNTKRGPLQIAIFGSSQDIATDDELQLARLSGLEFAKRGVSLITGGDDGVMGVAARTAKENGGVTIAVIARDKVIESTEIFDAIINTGLGWVQFSDVIIRSCEGALVIGGGAGTIGELSILYLSEKPFAFIGTQTNIALEFGNRYFDARKIFRPPVFDDPVAALDYIITSFSRVKQVQDEG